MPVTAFAVFLVSTAIILAVFGVVARSTSVRQDVDYASANRLRLLFFVSLGVILLAFLVLTLPACRIRSKRARPIASCRPSASSTPGRSPKERRRHSRTGTPRFSPSATVPVGAVVEFRVTTLDVNHGFSLYAPDGRLVAQTQAMPGYVNRLRVTFDNPALTPSCASSSAA